LDHRCHLTGGGIKPPNGAAVKSGGTERLGKVNPERFSGKDKGAERK